MPTLGRIPDPDARDAQFPMRLGIATTVVLPPSKMWRGQVLRVDQGDVGACVGFTGANWKGHYPTYTRITNQTGMDDYLECKKIDPWPGQEGSNDRYLAQVYVAQGRIDRYLWAQNELELKEWVLLTGPAMVGTNWYDSMFNPGEDAAAPLSSSGRRTLLKISGSNVGGHEWLIRGSQPYKSRRFYRMRNSWSGNWGDNGEAWIEDIDLYRLVFHEGGDALGAVEKRP